MKNSLLLILFLLLIGANVGKTQDVPADLEALLNNTLDSMRTVVGAKS